jgi:hypothetical protein
VLARADRRGGRYAAYALLAALRARPELSQLAPAFAARIGPAAVDTYFVRDDLDDRGRDERVLLDADDAGELDVVNDLLPAYVFHPRVTPRPTHALAARFRARAPAMLVDRVDAIVEGELARVEAWDSEFTPPPRAELEIVERLLAAPLPGLDRTWLARAVAFHEPSLAGWLAAAGALPADEAWERKLVSGGGALRVDGAEIEAARGANRARRFGVGLRRSPVVWPRAPWLRALTFEHARGSLPPLATADLPALESLRILGCDVSELPEWIGGLETLLRSNSRRGSGTA